MSTKQLYEKTSEGMKEVSPLVAIEDIYSKLSDTPLEAIISLYNHVKCEWKGSVADTRRTVPLFLRRSGLFITYNNGTKYVTEFFSAGTDQITTEGWVKDSNWTPVPDEDYISAGVKPGVGTIGYEQLSDNLKQLFREKVNVTNFPDDEDIASVDNMLKLKDREVNVTNFQSKGYIILRKNLRLVNGVVKNILTQNMINKPNTIYEIRYDFEFDNKTIEIPEYCTLKFNGGSFINADIILKSNCKIVNGHINIAENALILLNNNCTIENCTFTHVSWCKNGYGTLFAENKENIRIQNCTFEKQKRPAESKKCSSIALRNCKDFIINNITSYDSEGENIIISSGSGIVSNSILYNGWSGIGTIHYGASDSTPITEGDGTSSIVISDNIVINAIAAGITINSDNVICSNNQILWFGKDEDNKTIVMGPGIRLGHYFTHANNCLIDNNIIKWGKFVTNSGAPTSDRGISLDAGNNNVIQNNYIQGVPIGIGSSVTNKQGTIIKNNNINAIIGGIIIYHDISCTIENNNINVKQGIGLSSRSCDSVIKSNTIKFSDGIPDTDTLTDKDYCGFFIETGNNNCTISNNFVVAHNSLKIDTTDAKDVILTNNRFKSQEDYRINFTCENLIYKDNDICNQSMILPKKAYVDNNRIFGCINPAMRIEKCIEHIITNNHFESENSYAVSIYIANTTEIERCIINNNTCSSGVAFCQKEALSYYGNKLKTGFSPSYKDEINPLFFLNGQVVDSQGFPVYLIRGKSYDRPTLTENHAGAEYYDKTLKKKILWNGTEWTNVDGTALT